MERYSSYYSYPISSIFQHNDTPSRAKGEYVVVNPVVHDEYEDEAGEEWADMTPINPLNMEGEDESVETTEEVMYGNIL